MASIVACVNCGDTSGDFVLDEGYICTKCGAVQPEQLIDSGQEWRTFEDDDGSKIRAEAVDYEFGSLSTDISSSSFLLGDFEARNLSKYAKLAQSETEKSENYLKSIYSKLNELSDRLSLATVIRQTAKDIINQYIKKNEKNKKGIRKEAFILAALLLAAKRERGGRTLKGFSRATDVQERDIKRFYKLLLREPAISHPNGQMERKSVDTEVKELIEAFCNKLQKPYTIIKEAKEVATQAVAILEGKQPASIAAASILFIFHNYDSEHQHQELATVAGISSNTLRNVFKEMRTHVDQLPNHLFRIKTAFPLAS